jgi:heme/copper-type cytochrome/quinol oxidase subunit 3
MSSSTPSLHVVPSLRREPVIDSAVLATLIFIVTEVMLFAGLISGLEIVRANHVGPWPPPDQARLPIEAIAFNTLVLLASGVFLYLAGRAYKRQPITAKTPFAIAIGLGAFFVVFQGVEWVRLIGEGLTMTSSTLGAFFYLIVGMHALHASATIVILCRLWLRLSRLKLQPGAFKAAQAFWFFVVGLWPILYLRVYL